MRVGLAVHPLRPEARTAARMAAETLTALGAEAVEVPLDVPDRAAVSDEVVAGLDLLIGIGGDGTFLRTAHLARDHEVPVLGVNVGRLGFLAEVEADGLEAALAALVAGEHRIVERATLEVEVLDAGGGRSASDWALNEVAIEKTSRERLVRLDVDLDGERFAAVPADALIVATSTGSTAYALSAGGPIVSPHVEATLVVPVAPHSLFDRTLVTGPRDPVVVSLERDQRPAVVTCDGREPMRLEPGGSVRVVGGGRPVRLATLAASGFFPRVRRKFRLP